MAHIHGEQSQVIARRQDGTPNPLPADMIEIAIPEANHHVMVDQPLALVAALRTLLKTWPS